MTMVMPEGLVIAPQGWQCPICKRVYSPSQPWCLFCGNESVTTTNATDFDLVVNPDGSITKMERVTLKEDARPC